MSYTVGELVELKREAMTSSVRQMAGGEQLVATKEIFFTKKDLKGTDVAKWYITRANRRKAGWVNSSGTSKRVDRKKGRLMTASFGTIFLSMALEEEVALWVKPTMEDNAIDYVGAHIAEIQRDLKSLADNTVEHAMWQALLYGQIAIDQADAEGEVKFTALMGMKATHLAQFTTMDWSDASAEILSDTGGEAWADVRKILERDCGSPAAQVYMNDTTNRYLAANTEVKALFNDAMKGAVFSEFNVKEMDKIPCRIHDGTYDDDDDAAQLWIPNNYTIWLPERAKRTTFKVLEGDVAIPSEDKKTLDIVHGEASWGEVHSEPTEIRIYYKRRCMPIMEDPDAVHCQNVVPAS